MASTGRPGSFRTISHLTLIWPGRSIFTLISGKSFMFLSNIHYHEGVMLMKRPNISEPKPSEHQSKENEIGLIEAQSSMATSLSNDP
jgi:hypothetical protein